MTFFRYCVWVLLRLKDETSAPRPEVGKLLRASLPGPRYTSEKLVDSFMPESWLELSDERNAVTASFWVPIGYTVVPFEV